jgi:ceramide glucosyltransferase
MLDWIALAAAIVMLTVHLVSITVTARRQRLPLAAEAIPAAAVSTVPPPGAPASIPAVTIIRPVKGVDAFSAATLRSTFRLDPAPAAILFCVASADDPIIPIVRTAIADHPHIEARLLIGAERISDNPKLNNLVKGWTAATTPWIAFIDSNVLLTADALSRLFAVRRQDTGMICSPPIGTVADGAEARLEAAFLNTYQARWQSFAAACGFGFAQGKVMLFERATVEAAGGLEVLGHEPAEDAASTKVVRAQGKRIELIERFFAQPLGVRDWRSVWQRQRRWAMLRRATFPWLYATEILTGFWPAAIAATLALLGFDVEPSLALASLLVLAAVWYGSEAWLAHVAGWPERLGDMVLRDVLIPAVWVAGWSSRDVVWHGHAIRAERPAEQAG